MSFDKVYAEFQKTDIETLRKDVPGCLEVIESHKEIENLWHHMALFMMGTAHGDKKFDKAEFELLKPFLYKTKDMTYEEAAKIFETAVFDETDIELCRKNFKTFPEDVKDAITKICLTMAATDGKVSAEELEWIKAFAL